jgi:hypothetical protein
LVAPAGTDSAKKRREEREREKREREKRRGSSMTFMLRVSGDTQDLNEMRKEKKAERDIKDQNVEFVCPLLVAVFEPDVVGGYLVCCANIKIVEKYLDGYVGHERSTCEHHRYHSV